MRQHLMYSELHWRTLYAFLTEHEMKVSIIFLGFYTALADLAPKICTAEPMGEEVFKHALYSVFQSF